MFNTKNHKNEHSISRGKKLRRNGLIICNIILILSVVIFTLTYSRYIMDGQRQTRTDAFVSAVDSMKQVSKTYISNEQGYVDNWAAYITAGNMTLDEALDYIRASNTQADRQAHFVDMDAFEAHSTYKKGDSDSVNCYEKMAAGDQSIYSIFINNMRKMFSGDHGEVSIL